MAGFLPRLGLAATVALVGCGTAHDAPSGAGTAGRALVEAGGSASDLGGARAQGLGGASGLGGSEQAGATLIEGGTSGGNPEKTGGVPAGGGASGGSAAVTGGALAVGGASTKGGTASGAAGSVGGGSSPGGGATSTGGSSPTGSGGHDVTWWKPGADAPVHWHWQLSQDFEAPRDVLPHKTVYDIDGELATAETVAALHALGPEVKVICYFDAGVYEDYRSDAASFPASILGNADLGWEGSFWLDIRQLDVLMPILRNRALTWCKNKGFDAVEPDETEVWSNDPGFPITKEENNEFNRRVAEMVHELGMSVGLKGNNSEAAELVDAFDWALTEQCWEYDECALLRDSFIAAGKMVLNVEYEATPTCTLANQWHMNSSRRDLELVGPTESSYLYQPCIPDTQDTW